jgi:hypothetical protein
MPIHPKGSPVKFNISGIDTILRMSVYRSQRVKEAFQRIEFSNQRLREAPNANGTKDSFFTDAAGFLYQFVSDCNPGSNIRPTNISDDANLDNIFRRWDIDRYEVQGLPSLASDVYALRTLFQTHEAALARFENHQAEARNPTTSFEKLTLMQAETFSYLTTTGVTMKSFAFGTGSEVTISNILLANFVPDLEYEEPLNYNVLNTTPDKNTSSRVMCSWSGIIEVRNNRPASSATW